MTFPRFLYHALEGFASGRIQCVKKLNLLDYAIQYVLSEHCEPGMFTTAEEITKWVYELEDKYNLEILSADDNEDENERRSTT